MYTRSAPRRAHPGVGRIHLANASLCRVPRKTKSVREPSQTAAWRDAGRAVLAAMQLLDKEMTDDPQNPESILSPWTRQVEDGRPHWLFLPNFSCPTAEEITSTLAGEPSQHEVLDALTACETAHAAVAAVLDPLLPAGLASWLHDFSIWLWRTENGLHAALNHDGRQSFVFGAPWEQCFGPFRCQLNAVARAIARLPAGLLPPISDLYAAGGPHVIVLNSNGRLVSTSLAQTTGPEWMDQICAAQALQLVLAAPHLRHFPYQYTNVDRHAGPGTAAEMHRRTERFMAMMAPN